MEASSENFEGSRPLQSGFLLRNRYEIRDLIGEGGFAKTYLAQDNEHNRKCVVKALSLRNVDTFKAKELFDREAKVLANLNHPHIPKFIDFFTDDSIDGTQIYLVQEFKEGKNLSQLVNDGKHFTEKQVVQIGIRMAEILEYLQSFSPPIIHRDIKPSNILLNASNFPSLIDFGAVRDKILNDPLLRAEGPTIVGTYGYMPLEQFEGRAVPASDIYSLGVTLIYALSQKDPWEMEKQGMRLNFKPHVRISARFSQVLERMIDPDFEKRYASAAELKQGLQLLLQPAAEVTTARPVKRYKSYLVPLGILILAAFGVWYKYLTRSIPVIVNGRAPVKSTLSSDPVSPSEKFPPFLAPRDVSSMIEKQEHEKLTSYVFHGDLANAQTLDLQAATDKTLWVATSKGILRFDVPSDFRLFGFNAGIPGERVDSIAVGPNWVAADLSHETRPGFAITTGTYILDPQQELWTKVGGSAWELYRDGNILWIGTGDGVEARDLKTEEVVRFTKENSGLRHNQVHAIRRVGDVVWFGSLGDYVKKTRDFTGGGVSRLDLVTRQWSSFSTHDGLARDYSCAIAADEKSVWVAHWDPEYGLSHYDAATQRWGTVKSSENGFLLGGVVLALDAQYLWIGQQSGLIRLNRLTHEAVRYTEADGLPGYIISGIALTKNDVWVSAYAYGTGNIRSAGLVRIPRESAPPMNTDEY